MSIYHSADFIKFRRKVICKANYDVSAHTIISFIFYSWEINHDHAMSINVPYQVMNPHRVMDQSFRLLSSQLNHQQISSNVVLSEYKRK